MKGNHSQSHKQVRELNTSSITVEFKVTPDPIFVSFKHWRIQVLKGRKDQDMTKGIGMLNNQKVKKVISEWGMWWRWLMHSPPVWQASLEGLKVTTIVPNPLGISPQMQVSCGWRRVHMHKQYNIDCLCDLCYLSSMCWKFLFVCLLFALNVFTFFFYQSLFVFVSKIQKHIKVENPKSLIDIIVYCHKHVLPCTFVLMALCIYECSLYLMHLYHCEKNLDINVTVVNRSSNLS